MIKLSEKSLNNESVRQKPNLITQGTDNSSNSFNRSQGPKQEKIMRPSLSMQNLPSKHILSNLSTGLHNNCNKEAVLTLINNEWNERPESMTRIEFYYNLLTFFLKSYIKITYCSDHSPPCRPKVDTKEFEKNAEVLKNFDRSLRTVDTNDINIEMLVALENVVYAQPYYRPGVADIMDILYRKGVVEAVAFRNWSQIKTNRNEEKTRLIHEIRTSGFSLLKI